MNVQQYKNIILPLLAESFEEREADNLFKYALEDYFNKRYLDIRNYNLSDDELEELNYIYEKITNHYPIQYIFNKSEFYGLDFYVDENVLIPRAETEELVNWILSDAGQMTKVVRTISNKDEADQTTKVVQTINNEDEAGQTTKVVQTINNEDEADQTTKVVRPINNEDEADQTTKVVQTINNEDEAGQTTKVVRPINNETISLLDIGTGSGCIPIVIKKNKPNWKISALDISEKSLNIAQQNAQKHNVEIEFIQDDILSLTHDSQLTTYDFIVSNPPYIPAKEKELMSISTLQHEPSLALFVPDENPIIFYEKIADFAKQHLAENGKLYFELNEFNANDVQDMLKQKGFQNVIINKDFAGKDRMLRCEF